jgi:predicted AlkP superfamily pyrophosphatase or phosphodiesterase
LRPDYVLEADHHRLRIPNLRQMMKDGVWSTGVTGVLPTVTYPSHTTLLTGVAPARHGIISNTTFDPLRKNMTGWYWYAGDIRALTLWEAVAKSGGDALSVHWPVGVDAPVRWNLPQYWRAGTPDDRKLVRALSTAGLVDEVEQATGPYADGIDESLAGDRQRTKAAVWLLKTKKPRLATIYLTALDHAQHSHGPFSKDANETLEGIDELFGQIREAAGPDAVVCVVSDHGFLPIRKEIHLNVALVHAGLIKTKPDGTVDDWQASSWASGGTAAVMTRTPEAAGKARAALKSVEGVGRVVEGAELKAMKGYPDAAFVLAAARGYAFGNDVSGEVIRDSSSRGTHGYMPDERDMDASFFLAGPRVHGKGELGRIDMRDVAPTLAALLGVALPEAEGANLLADH